MSLAIGNKLFIDKSVSERGSYVYKFYISKIEIKKCFVANITIMNGFVG